MMYVSQIVFIVIQELDLLAGFHVNVYLVPSFFPLSFLLKIMKLEIEEISALRSFVFLWCGSGEGLDLGRMVT